MLVLLIWAGALLVGLLAGGLLGYEVFGHVRRLLRAVAAADAELRPQIAQLVSQTRLTPSANAGRHRAPLGPVP